MTEAEREMMQALCQQVIVERCRRSRIVGATEKGRCIVEFHGEVTEAELMWESIRERSVR